MPPVTPAAVLALAFVYLYRLPSAAARAAYWEALRGAMASLRLGQHAKFDRCGFRAFVLDGGFQRVRQHRPGQRQAAHQHHLLGRGGA